ncbi:hypothetical protein ACBJ59_59200 [Nonomuraea sp. MTCD27]|uniref:hypothetical protein n=1 Tax=Nonomuraea sp. MTCD27 TaxID=1676747 RepID=UPI0035C012CA
MAQVFPGTVPGLSPSGARVTYELAGVAPEAPCRAAFQPAAVRPGCRTALRATYADSTQTFVVTVGIAVLDRPALTALGAGPRGTGPAATAPPETVRPGTVRPETVRPETVRPETVRPETVRPETVRPETVRPETVRPETVRPVAFPGGPAAWFGDRQYFTGVVVGSGEHYVVATAAGYADGRAYQPGDRVVPRLRDAARQLAATLHRALTG